MRLLRLVLISTAVMGICELAHAQTTQGFSCCIPENRPLDCPNGVTCCQDSTWQCNDDASGSSTCDMDGVVCSCDGIGGRRCAEGEYCKHDEFETEIDCIPNGADFPGTCTLIPLDCSICNHVCGCNGQNYLNACLAFRDGTLPHYEGSCGDVSNVEFRRTGAEVMDWAEREGALSYNLYRKVYSGAPPTDAGSCYFSGIPSAGVIGLPNPEPGELWFLQVSGVFPNGEGGLGWSGGNAPCLPRFPVELCSAGTSLW